MTALEDRLDQEVLAVSRAREAAASEHRSRVAANTRDFARRIARRTDATNAVVESSATVAARAETTLRWAGYTLGRQGVWSRTTSATTSQVVSTASGRPAPVARHRAGGHLER